MLYRSEQVLPSKDYSAIKAKIENDYNNNINLFQQYWNQAAIDMATESGDVTGVGSADYNQMGLNSNAQFFFNHTRPITSMVSGYQRRNRKSLIVVGLENSDDHTSDQYTRVMMHISQSSGLNNVFSTAFHEGACLTGLSLVHAYVDYTQDIASGDIKVEALPYNSFIIDPYSKQLDLSDASFVWRRSYMNHSAVASLLPEDCYDEIMSLPGNPPGITRNNKFMFMPQVAGQTRTNLLSYDEYYYRDYMYEKLLHDKETGDLLDITGQDQVDIDFFLEMNPKVEVVTRYVPTVRLAIMVQDKVFYDGASGLKRYPFVAVRGYYNSSAPLFYNRIQGIVRSLRDPQMLLNRRIILSLDILESQLNSGYIFKESSLVDMSQIFQTGQGKAIALKDSAQMTDIQPIQAPQIPPSILEIQKALADEMNIVSGVTLENMGQVTNDTASGYKTALRQGAGLTTLQSLFDNADESLKILGSIIMDLVRANYTPGKIQKILGGEQPAPLFYNKAFGRYQCDVQLGFDTETQRQLQFAQLMDLKTMGVNIPDKTLIDAATLQNKEDLLKDIEQIQQAQQKAQEQQQAVEMENLRARAELTRAQSQAEIGLGIERVSRVQENKALAIERRAEAVKDDNQALLNYVKAMKEIENIDLEQLQKVLSIKAMLDAQTATKAAQEEPTAEVPQVPTPAGDVQP